MKLMKTREAARYIGICANTLRSWAKERPITHMVDPVTGYRYFKKEDLDTFMESLKSGGKC